MPRKNNFFKKLFGNKKQNLSCRFDDRTGEYYCYVLKQGVYERVSGPYQSLEECRNHCGCEDSNA
jgi:hypothetical protein